MNPRGYPAKLIDEWLNGKFDSVISFPILEEIIKVMNYGRIKDKYGIKPEEIEEYIEIISTHSIIVFPKGNLKICRDINDNIILETAIIGKVDFVVSRDSDITYDSELIDYLKKENIKVLSVSKILQEIKLNIFT